MYLRVSSLRLSMKLMSETTTSVPRSPSAECTGSRATCTEPLRNRTTVPLASVPEPPARRSSAVCTQPIDDGRFAVRYATRCERSQNAIA